MIRVRSKTIKPLSEGHIYDVLNMSLVGAVEALNLRLSTRACASLTLISR